MKRLIPSLILILICLFGAKAQSKIPLDHSVYDLWQDIGKMNISSNGRFVYYEVNVQKGDGMLYVQSSSGDTIVKVNRGESGLFTKDNKYFICKIAAPFVDKEAKAKAVKQSAVQPAEGKARGRKDADMSLDSLLIYDLVTARQYKFAALKGDYKIAGLTQNVLAWLSETDTVQLQPKVKDSVTVNAANKKTASPAAPPAELQRMDKYPMVDTEKDHKKDKAKADYQLNIWSLTAKGLDSLTTLRHVKSFQSDTTSDDVALTSLAGRDLDSQSLEVVQIKSGRLTAVLKKAKEVKALAMTDQSGKGSLMKLAFIATGVDHQDTLGKHNDLYLWQEAGGVRKVVSYNQSVLYKNWGVSPYARLQFSRSGERLFFETAPLKPEPDSLEPAVALDIWNTQSDILFTEHQANMDRFNKRGYKAVYLINQDKLWQLEDSVYADLVSTYKGDGRYFYLGTDSSRRIAKQWLGYTIKDYFIVDMNTGARTKILQGFEGRIYPSYKGDKALIYDRNKRQYELYDAFKNSLTAIDGFSYPLYDEQDDHAEAPSNYGVLGWDTLSHAVYVYDRYDIYRIDPKSLKPSLVGKSGREQKLQTRLAETYQQRGPFYFNGRQKLSFDRYAEDSKKNQFVRFSVYKPGQIQAVNELSDHMASHLVNARDNAENSMYTLENYETSPQVYLKTRSMSQRLSQINQQQEKYCWGHAQLFKWKAYTGKQTEGILYLPDHLDTTKKYPMITYFYERRNETLYKYIPPKPTGSALNISFFVSRGYVVFVPDIWYTIGHPGQSAYDYVISGVKAVAGTHPFIDTTRLGMQGQSWGGYQVAYLVTRTDLFKAAWAGAPVVDMFSAYGGIRWKTGASRAMQYEKGQSRIGATPWENKGLYIENSPLFNIPRIHTPLVIMSNDGDGAVPWYQGIEFFMALRRFGKKAWLLNYRGEEHNLVKRSNKLDIQKKEAEFFDWQLKGASRPGWTF
ncbi:Prolyl oligopeptidase family protein [Arachidicoccus rhizosphaerae]|uniref:Prolyl oligopeptidase family protein n=1 Tax=Arachidicoccus rhizosphaerae TaxID=551991 RepID=A0A1H4C3P2_9BACT|nr:prolyl oligopeptidase family serine peptidase [Arachidicoccus rhizosphaerae]SEA55065.1 Prolyl oligopeptidase family protein [Arachidicoccus rhizosphaerae]